MKVGITVARFKWGSGAKDIGPKFAEIARTAEESGVNSLWVMDHFFQLAPMLGAVDDPMLEAYTTLGFAAGVTKKIKLGVLVTGVIYREPALLVKAATTLDVLSGGRTYFGIGAAWYEREAVGLGFPFPSLTERFERLEETLQIAKLMWGNDRSEFKGKHYNLKEPINSPQPLSKPHPPIMIGGGGEKKTLRMVAQYGDACNLFAMLGKKELVHKLDVLKAHCKTLGRDYDEIEKTVLDIGGNMDAKEIIAKCKELASIGIEHVIFGIPDLETLKPLEILGKEIIPEVKKL